MARASSATSAVVTSGAKRVPPADTGAPGRSNTTNPGTKPSSMISGPPRSRRASGSPAMRSPMSQTITAHRPASVREVDPHHHTPRAGVSHLGKAGVGEDLATPDVKFAPGDLLARRRGHRVRLQRPGAPFPREADRGGGQRVGDPALAVPL